MKDVFESLIERERDRRDARFYGVVCAIVLAFAAILLTFVIFYGGVMVYGDSMNPTLTTGDCLVVYTRRECVRGDIVIIDGEKSNGGKLIKRVIAMGGDEIKSENGYVYLKRAGETEFTKLDEPYVLQGGITTVENLVIPQGEIYYLGDNRGNSSDSRGVFGTCKQSQISGVVASWSIKLRPFTNYVNKIIN